MSLAFLSQTCRVWPLSPDPLTPSLRLLSRSFAAIGFFPDVGASYYLARLPAGWGLYLGLTGARVTGANVVRAATLRSASFSSTERERALKDRTGASHLPLAVSREGLASRTAP